MRSEQTMAEAIVLDAKLGFFENSASQTGSESGGDSPRWVLRLFQPPEIP
jgi:hypothetical protein